MPRPIVRKALLAEEGPHASQRCASREAAHAAVGRHGQALRLRRTARQATLSDLFVGHSQLLVYHLMLAPDSTHRCPGCSFLVDHIDGANHVSYTPEQIADGKTIYNFEPARIKGEDQPGMSVFYRDERWQLTRLVW